MAPVLGGDVTYVRDAAGNVQIVPAGSSGGFTAGATSLLGGIKDLAATVLPFLPTLGNFGQQPGFTGGAATVGPGIIQQAGLVSTAGRAVAKVAPEVLGGAGAALGIEALSSLFGGSSETERMPRRIQKIKQLPDGSVRVYEYVSRGRPILYSGDISAARRVRKVANRAASRLGRSRRSTPRASMPTTTVVCGKCARVPCSCGV